MSVKIDEKCGCGAEFHWVGYTHQTANEAAAKWRAEHRHTEAGICGEGAGFTGADEPTCILKAGHAGWHSDKQGCNWGQRRYESKVGAK